MKELRLSLFGLIVMAIVLFLPRGLMGFMAARRERRGEESLATSAAAAKPAVKGAA
jgi:branched-chain amino acid transport system permease protein